MNFNIDLLQKIDINDIKYNHNTFTHNNKVNNPSNNIGICINGITEDNSSYKIDNFKLYINNVIYEESELKSYIDIIINTRTILEKKYLILSLLNYNNNIFNNFIIKVLLFNKFIKNNNITLFLTEEYIPLNILHFIIFYNLNLDNLLYVLLLLYYIYDKDIFSYETVMGEDNKIKLDINNLNYIYYNIIWLNNQSGKIYKSINIGLYICDKIINFNDYNLDNINKNFDYNYEDIFLNDITINYIPNKFDKLDNNNLLNNKITEDLNNYKNENNILLKVISELENYNNLLTDRITDLNNILFRHIL